MNDYTTRFLLGAGDILRQMDTDTIESLVDIVRDVRETGGRLFFIGVGGGAGHASHAVNDFRKIVGVESYTPTDNVSELTARINDDGWDTCFANWLRGSRIGRSDCLFVFSVGGGNEEKKVSVNIVNAIKVAKEVGARVLGVVGRDGGFTAKHADACVVVPTVDPEMVTTHTEAFQAVIWHLLVGHPRLQRHEMKWESLR